MPFLLFLLVTLLIPLSGHFLLLGLFGKNFRLSTLERFVFSFMIGVGSLDFSMIFLGESGVVLSAPIVFSSFIAIPLAACILRLGFERFASGKTVSKSVTREDMPHDPVRFSPIERKLFVLLIGLTIFLKTIFLADAGLPTGTDLGHHSYWAKIIVDTGRLPDYSKREIVETEDGHSTLSSPEPISDFIIGEHLPFAAVAKLSGASFISAFPVSFLLLIDILSIISLFTLAIRLATRFFPHQSISPVSVGLAVLLFAGPLFAFSSPEAKFVSGGVVGNLIGDLAIPLVILAFFRAFTEEDSRFLGLGILLSFILAYTHHLSTFILVFILAGIILTLIAVSFRDLPGLGKRIGKLFLSPYPILMLAFTATFMTFVSLPTYIATNAVTTAVGTPSKATRTGLSFFQVSDSAGSARMSIGIAALLLIAAIRPIRRSQAFPFLFGWGFTLLLITLHPNWVFLDIPSNRIGNYVSFPFSVLAGLFLAAFPALFRKSDVKNDGVLLPGGTFLFAALVLFAFSTWNGSHDNQSSLSSAGKAQETVEVFHASRYLADRSLPDDLFLKDHNYLAADAWMKLFFMRDYAYPLSRGYFKRYTDEANPREQCTLRMISVPNLPEGRKCYEDLNVNLLGINPAFDATQFEKSHDFSRIYAGSTIQLYERDK
ncbi:MAG: hypothetical protein HGA31_01770 [Candidatus Moranbacteria bacterium]|nr:hypothetical protein [Candidatus Moranbacteria bacterium]